MQTAVFSKPPKTFTTDRYEIFKKILKKKHQDNNYPALQPSLEDLIQHELNSGHGVVTNVEFQQVTEISENGVVDTEGGTNVFISY